MSTIHTLATYIARQGSIRFVVYVACLTFAVKIPMGILGALLIGIFQLEPSLFGADQQIPTLAADETFFAIIVAPFIETLAAQLLPIELLRRFIPQRAVLVASAGVFMVLHFPAIEFFPSAFAIGCIFAWAWLEKRPKGIWIAFTYVTLIHSLHNALASLFTAIFFLN